MSTKAARHIEEDLETSDDDYIDPDMDKYFNTNKKEKDQSAKNNGKKLLEMEREDSESDEEMEEASESENSDDEEAVEGEEMDEDNEENGEEDGSRIQLTSKMIEKWSQKLRVRISFFIS